MILPRIERPSSSVPSGCSREGRSSDFMRFGAEGLPGKSTGASKAVRT